MSRRLRILALILLVPLAVPPAYGDEHPDPARLAFSAIDTGRLMTHIEHLASTKLGGRDTGSEGNRLAAEYMAEQFRKYGLRPVGDRRTYFQNFTIGSTRGIGRNNRLVIRSGRKPRIFVVSKDFTPFSFSGNRAAAGPLVFAGYGITSADHRFDDYAGLDVKGKIVLIMRHEPREQDEDSPFAGRRFTRHAYFTTKASNAQQHGAAALLVVTDPAHHKDDPLFGTQGAGETDVKIPVVHMKRRIAELLFKEAGKDLLAVQKEIDRTLKPRSFPLDGVRVEVVAELVRTPVPARNVVGFLEGSDPRLKDEIVVIGGHYDHLGLGHYGSRWGGRGRGKIHPGADDNASGTAGVIELARVFATKGLRPRRSLLFMGFTGEERGLLGSRHYVEHPIFPLKGTVAMINLDMIGRGETGRYRVSGLGTSPKFDPVVRTICKRLGHCATFGQSGFAPSDNTSFYRKQVPVLFFFTGLHRDYHSPTDTADKINRKNLTEVTRAVYLVVYWLSAVLDERPAFRQAEGLLGRWLGRRRGPARRGPFLGVEAGDRSGPGFGVGRVIPGSPAARAGMRDGDRIVRFGKRPVHGFEDLAAAVRGARIGDKVVVRVVRSGKEVDLTVTLRARSPARRR